MCIDRANGNSFFAVELKSSGKMIGHIYFEHIIPKEYMTWELGYIFNPIFQKKGYCTEAAAKLVEFAFKEFHAHRITAYCNPDNIASWKVLEKIGMKKEGYFSKKAFFRRNDDGSPIWHDCIAYGLLNE
jgi:RimJ/RimL family protein N-acetyltransferase